MSKAVAISTIDPIELEICWNRMIAIVDEAAAALVRTSFSTVVRESNDFACVLLDERGYSIAQSTLSIPGFIGTAALTLRKFLEVQPPESLEPGDILFSNDPWICTGHLPDSTMAAPVFKGGRIVAFILCVAHLSDIGGRQWSADANEVHEEGLLIPVIKLYRRGRVDDVVMSIIEGNVRVPERVLGDLNAQLVAIRVASQRLEEFMHEYRLPHLRELADAILSISETAMRREIELLRPGTYRAEVEADGFEEPIRVRASITVGAGRIHVDYSGSSTQSPFGINETYNHAFAYTVYPFKCMLCPTIPNNEGFVRLIDMHAPVGSIVNCKRPAAVGARQLVGHLLQGAIFEALAEIAPDRVQADSGTPLWTVVLRGTNTDTESAFSTILFFNGGMGAMAGRDGRACTSFPANISNTPIEITESIAPLLFRSKRIASDSGGSGLFRGGSGQIVEIESRSKAPVRASLMAERTRTAPRGLLGGLPGQPGFVKMNGVPVDNPKGTVELHAGDVLEIGIPGGGGYGQPLR